jgi:hypothetical protein
MLLITSAITPASLAQGTPAQAVWAENGAFYVWPFLPLLFLLAFVPGG